MLDLQGPAPGLAKKGQTDLKPGHGCLVPQAIGVEGSGRRLQLKWAVLHAQAKRLARAAAAQLHKRQVRAALHRVGDSSCGLLGGFAGWNRQLDNNIVFGLEGDLKYDWNSKKYNGFETGTDWGGSARVRLGYAFDDALIYATGGWARSTALMELRASAFREPITVVDEPELVGLGAALLALEAATGRAVTFTPSGGLRVIDPLGRWSEAYAGL